MSEAASRDADIDLTPEQRADRLKERVYVTFTALAVTIALRAHVDSPGQAARTLLITVIGTVLAVFVADVVSHIAVHEKLPLREELEHMLSVSFGALGALALPFVFVGLAVLGVWEIEVALRASSLALVAALIAIGYAAARKARLPTWQRLVVLFAEFMLGGVVVALELIAHG